MSLQPIPSTVLSSFSYRANLVPGCFTLLAQPVLVGLSQKEVRSLCALARNALFTSLCLLYWARTDENAQSIADRGINYPDKGWEQPAVPAEFAKGELPVWHEFSVPVAMLAGHCFRYSDLEKWHVEWGRSLGWDERWFMPILNRAARNSALIALEFHKIWDGITPELLQSIDAQRRSFRGRPRVLVRPA